MNGLHHQVAKIQGLDHLSLQKNPVPFDPKMFWKAQHATKTKILFLEYG